MAHQLETWRDGSASFVSAREHAWHRLGTVLPSGFDASQAMQHAKLGGWSVRMVGIQTAPVIDESGVTPALEVLDRFATVHQSMSRDEMLLEYLKTTKTGTYLIPPGVSENGFIGEGMFS